MKYRVRHIVFVFCIMILSGFTVGVSAHSRELLPDLPAYHEDLCAERLDHIPEIFCEMKPSVVRLTDPEGETFMLHVLVAHTSQQRAAGYQHIPEDAIARTAILFEFEREIAGAFHMCNVEAPLDIVWVRGDEKVLDAGRMLPGARRPAGGCRNIYAPSRPGAYKWALETPAGLLEAVNFDSNNPLGWRITADL